MYPTLCIYICLITANNERISTLRPENKKKVLDLKPFALLPWLMYSEPQDQLADSSTISQSDHHHQHSRLQQHHHQCHLSIPDGITAKDFVSYYAKKIHVYPSKSILTHAIGHSNRAGLKRLNARPTTCEPWLYPPLREDPKMLFAENLPPNIFLYARTQICFQNVVPRCCTP